jgi:hypothetical protein
VIILVSLDTLKLDSLWKIAKRWRAGFEAERVDSARKEIISMGEGAVYYVITRNLTKKDLLGVRAIRDICQKEPSYCTRGILEVLSKKDSLALKNALFVAGEVEIPKISEKLLEILKKQREGIWISRTLRAIYRSGDGKICEVLDKYTRHPYEYVRMRSALLIGQKNCEKLKDKAWEMLNDSVFTVRDAAKLSLAKMGFSLREFEKRIDKVPEHEIMKLLYISCPSRDYLDAAEKRVRREIFQTWKEFVNCK